MNALEAAGIQFTAGNGAGLGVRQREVTNSLEQFLVFLKLYEHNRLRSKSSTAWPLKFGYVFVYHNRDGADLMFQGRHLGSVRWLDGDINFDPPLPNQRIPALDDDTFDAWVSRAQYRATTGI